MNWIPITSPPKHGQLVLTYSPEASEEGAFRILRFGGHPRGFPEEVRFWMELIAPERQDAPEHRCGLQGYNPMLGDTCPACDAILGRAAVDETHEDMAEAHGRRVDEALLGLREPEPEPEEYTPGPLPDMGLFGNQYQSLLGFRISLTSPRGNLLNHPMVKYAGRYVGGMADSFSWDPHKLAKMPIGDLEKLRDLLTKTP